MKWFIAIIILIFVFIGTESYKNIELIRSSYTLQQIQKRVEEMEKENLLLKKKLSSSLSLRNIEKYAREKLKLEVPVEVRFIKERTSGGQAPALQ